jgi:hypothetical protein
MSLLEAFALVWPCRTEYEDLAWKEKDKNIIMKYSFSKGLSQSEFLEPLVA